MSGCVVLEAFSSRARFICTTVVQIGVAVPTAAAAVFYGACTWEACKHGIYDIYW